MRGAGQCFLSNRYLRSKGYCKGLDVDTLGDAKSEGALAVYPVIARYMRRYQAALSYERVIRRAHNAERRFLRSEARERHASLDYHVVKAGDGHEVKVYDGAHLNLEQKGLSLEESAILHETFEAVLGRAVEWPMVARPQADCGRSPPRDATPNGKPSRGSPRSRPSPGGSRETSRPTPSVARGGAGEPWRVSALQALGRARLNLASGHGETRGPSENLEPLPP